MRKILYHRKKKMLLKPPILYHKLILGIWEKIMWAFASSALATTITTSAFAGGIHPLRHRISTFTSNVHHYHHNFQLRAVNESDKTQLSAESSAIAEKSEADKIVDGMDFGELCNEFECISSPSVESTARQLARDILELRQGNRALGNFALSVKYKDPLRSFTGRDKYKRSLWVTTALQNPTVTVQQMKMLSTSVLSIKWTVKGRPKSVIGSISGDIIIRVNSQFVLNQISGQVIEHEELWDLSDSSALAQAFFWASRRLFAADETRKDFVDFLKNFTSSISTKEESVEIFQDPSGDPTKFFERDDSFQRDAYQIALFLAVVYLIVQFLRTTL